MSPNNDIIHTADAAFVSVVITTYNHAHYLHAAIESVLAQTVSPLEIIVVDDGSSDDPSAVTARYPGIRLIRQANQGLASARNTGLRAAVGYYVLFLDADDLLRPRAVEANLAQFEKHPQAGFVYGAYRFVNEAGNLIREQDLRPVGDEPYVDFLKANCIGMHATVLYCRDRLAEIGGFDVSLRACEDYDVYLRMSQRFPVVCSPELIADYRQHSQNMSRNSPMMLAAALQVLRKQEANARTDDRCWRAFEIGAAAWKAHYISEHIQKVWFVLRGGGDRLAVARQTAAMIKVAPTTTLAIGIQKIFRVAKKLRAQRPLRLGDLRRTTPVSTEFGYDRGKPIDRRYVEAFLACHAPDINGRVLEIGDNSYTMQYGGKRVATADVFNRHPGHPQTTFVGDLAGENDLPTDSFDCIVLTQTLHLIFDMPAAIATLWRILRPGGVLLVTVPWVSPIDRGEWGETWYWSLAPAALRRLLSEQFGGDWVRVEHCGNVLSATAFLYGLAENELAPNELDVHDPHCPVIVAGRAVKVCAVP